MFTCKLWYATAYKGKTHWDLVAMCCPTPGQLWNSEYEALVASAAPTSAFTGNTMNRKVTKFFLLATCWDFNWQVGLVLQWQVWLSLDSQLHYPKQPQKHQLPSRHLQLPCHIQHLLQLPTWMGRSPSSLFDKTCTKMFDIGGSQQCMAGGESVNPCNCWW